MNKRVGLVLVFVGFALGVSAPMAGAKVAIMKSDGNRQVDTFTRGKCWVRGKKDNRSFVLQARSDQNKFSLSAYIDAPVFKGFGEYYIAYYGGEDPQIFLRRRSDDALFGNLKLPGTPPNTVGAGAIAFRKQGLRVGIGLYGATNRAGTEGYSFAGPINCKYARR